MSDSNFDRDEAIATYLAASDCPSLALGVWQLGLEGWLNTDYKPVGHDVLPLDVTQPFPFDDNVFNYVASEHMIEHISFTAGRHMLAESCRVLKPGGRIRIATPNLRRYLDLFNPALKPIQKKFVNWIMNCFLPDSSHIHPVFVLNNLFYNFGHQAIYDETLLTTELCNAGFEQVQSFPPGVSECDALKGIERHGKAVGDEFNNYETMVLEARKPFIEEA